MDSKWLNDLTEEKYPTEEQNSSRDWILLKCKETIEALTQDLEYQRQARLAAEGQVQALQQDLGALEDHLDAVEANSRDSEGVRCQHIQRQLTEQSTQLLSVSQQRGEIQAAYQKAAKELQGVKEELCRKSEELIEKEESISEWNRTLETVERKMSELTQENKRLKEENQRIAFSLQKEREQGSKLQGLWENANAEIHSLQLDLQRSTEAKLQQSALAEKEKLSLQQELTEQFNAKAEQYHAQIQHGLQEQKSLIEKASQELELLQDTNSELSQQLADVLSELEEKKRYCEELEQEGQRTQRNWEDVEETHRGELEAKNRMYAEVLSQLEEEREQTTQYRNRIETLNEELARREKQSQYQLSARDRDLEASEQRIREQSESLEEAQRATQQAQQSLSNSVFQLRSEYYEEKQNLLKEAADSRGQAIATLEARIREGEMQRESDHEFFQIEILRLKDQYTEALIAKEQQVKQLQSERDHLSGTVSDLEKRIVSLAQLRSDPPKASLRFGFQDTQKTMRGSSTLSSRQSLKSPRASLSRDEWRLKAEPFPSSPQADGLQLLSQLKALTTKLEQTKSASRYA